MPNVILMNQNEQEESLYNSTRICMTFADDALIDALPKETFHRSAVCFKSMKLQEQISSTTLFDSMMMIPKT